MSVIINTNVSSIKIRNILTSAASDMSKSMARMSCGLKILSSKDDSSGAVISSKMKVQLNGNSIAIKNIQNANSMLSTTESNLTEILKNLTRVRDLTLQAKNGTYSTDEISAMQDEAQELIAEIDRINSSATFSSLKLFDDKLSETGISFQVGSNGGKDNSITACSSLFESVDFEALTDIKYFDFTEFLYEINEVGEVDPNKKYTYSDFFYDRTTELGTAYKINEEVQKEYEWWYLKIHGDAIKLKNGNIMCGNDVYYAFLAYGRNHGVDPNKYILETISGTKDRILSEEGIKLYEKFLKDPYVAPVEKYNEKYIKTEWADSFLAWKNAGNSMIEYTFDETIQKLDSAIDNITARMSELGSIQNRIDSAFDINEIQDVNLNIAKSLITDSDIAADASSYTQKSILQQVATSLLAQANQSPSIALSLI